MEAKILPVLLTETFFELVDLKMSDQNSSFSHMVLGLPIEKEMSLKKELNSVSWDLWERERKRLRERYEGKGRDTEREREIRV